MTKELWTPEKMISILADYCENESDDLLFCEIHDALIRLDPTERHTMSLELILYRINKPERLAALALVDKCFKIPPDEYHDILKNIWTDTEFPHQYPIPKLVSMFQKTSREKLMDKNELATYNAFPDTIIVYRGLPDKKAKIRGLSWTTNPEKAGWFAYRWARLGMKGEGRVFRAEIDKKHIFMYCDGRHESECVVNPSKLKNIELYNINIHLPS